MKHALFIHPRLKTTQIRSTGQRLGARGPLQLPTRRRSRVRRLIFRRGPEHTPRQAPNAHSIYICGVREDVTPDIVIPVMHAGDKRACIYAVQALNTASCGLRDHEAVGPNRQGFGHRLSRLSDLVALQLVRGHLVRDVLLESVLVVLALR